MQLKELVNALVLNCAILGLIASFLSRLQPVQDMILQEKRNIKGDLLLSLIFGGIIILSTVMGIDTGVYSLNTRTIGTMAAGLLGGPLVGFFSSIIGALYVLFFSTSKVFARSAAFSTLLVGCLGPGFYPYFQRGKWNYKDLFLLACFAELCEMASILRMTVTLHVAIETILDITLPMILLNETGLLLFIANFNTVFIRQDLESSRQLQKVSAMAERCIPLLRDGLGKEENMQKMASVILEETDWVGVMVTNQKAVLGWQGKEVEQAFAEHVEIPKIGKKAMREKQIVILEHVPAGNEWYELTKDYSVMAAPFLFKNEPVGCMIIWMKKQWVFRQSEVELLQHLMTLVSSQLALQELEQQEIMLQKAEFKALQFQVNPHFLFNALNTISCVCREDPDQARELLLVLANYFRYNLNYEAYMVSMEEELNHVKDYLEIEKARFEEKLQISYDIPEHMNMEIPTLILQPIVENAVRYGIDCKGRRIVHIEIKEKDEGYVVRISDKGKGFPPEVLENLEQNKSMGNSIGLSNVDKRLKSIYGENNGLRIESSENGSTVELRFFKG